MRQFYVYFIHILSRLFYSYPFHRLRLHSRNESTAALKTTEAEALEWGGGIWQVPKQAPTQEGILCFLHEHSSAFKRLEGLLHHEMG
jgi:hypothetical protein